MPRPRVPAPPASLPSLLGRHAGLTLLTGLTLAVLAACGGSRGAEFRPPPLKFAPVSPNGEVLGLATGDEAAYRATLAEWFRRADASANGSLGVGEIVADADRMFALFDADRDGRVTSVELTAYRVAHPHQPPRERPTSSLRIRSLTVDPQQVEPPAEGARERRPTIRTALDPVMSADSDLDFSVSREELRAQARRRFAAYDRDGDGKVTLDEFVAAQIAAVEQLRRE